MTILGIQCFWCPSLPRHGFDAESAECALFSHDLWASASIFSTFHRRPTSFPVTHEKMECISTQGTLYAPGPWSGAQMRSTTNPPHAQIPLTLPNMIVQPTDTQINASMNTSLHPSRRPSNATEKRVSKAKKGKRVHVCEFPGCEKVSRVNTRHRPRRSKSLASEVW